MTWFYKLLNNSILKKMIMFPEKHVRVSEKSRTCFSGNTYVFFSGSYDRVQKRT